MQERILTKPSIQNSTIAFDLSSIQVLKDFNLSEKREKHFTKAISGEPGLNAPSVTHYPRSYSADGPGGGYQGL